MADLRVPRVPPGLLPAFALLASKAKKIQVRDLDAVGPSLSFASLREVLARQSALPLSEARLIMDGIINLVHVFAPEARICFNTTPADTAEAVQRWVEP